MNLIKYDLFKSQNPEIGRYDVTFDVDGKLLYAHKLMLTLVSDTFDSMLSDRWMTKDEPIKIKDYSYADFYQFMTFLYSAQCKLSPSNIYAMVDMAEFCGVNIFKEYCDEYLASMKITNKNIFKLMDLADKYSMELLKRSIRHFITNNCQSFSDSDGFLESSKFFIKELAVAFKDRIIPEDMFQAVFKWCEKQAIDKQTDDPSLNLNDAIKAEISDLLPFIQFHKMSIKFMVKFIVPRGFIFSSLDELSNILSDGLAQPQVKVKNLFGETSYANFIPDKYVIQNAKSLMLTTCTFTIALLSLWIFWRIITFGF